MSHNEWASILRKEFAKIIGDAYTTWPLEIDFLIYDWASKLSRMKISGPRIDMDDARAWIDVSVEPLATLEEVRERIKP